MLNYDEILACEPYALGKIEKEKLLLDFMQYLTVHHYNNCFEYHKILDAFNQCPGNSRSLNEIPFLPLRLFKEFDMKSVANTSVVKTITSSGTSGQQPSKINLDNQTAANQSKILTRIVSSYIGKTRLPMIILDTSAVLKNRKKFSARGAGILGFSIFGRDRMYALDEDMNLDLKGIDKFLDKHANEKILLFGFTFMIWQHFYELLNSKGYHPDLSKGVLIHGGGWKKLTDKAVSSYEFKQKLKEICGIEQVYDYYGMVEQTGTIYMECEFGHLHASVYSDIIVRRHEDFSAAAFGEKGIIQVLSILPLSYPGHSLLTEDEGAILGEDDCPCGRKGKYFKVLGRVKRAEIRGCSDTYASEFTAS